MASGNDERGRDSATDRHTYGLMALCEPVRGDHRTGDAPESARRRRPALTGTRVAAWVAIAAVAALLLVGVQAAPAGAHPLGNFTINTYAELRIGTGSVQVHYVVDMAEIPTIQTKPQIDTNGDDKLSDAEKRRYVTNECRDLAANVHVRVATQAVVLRPSTTKLTFPPGQAGLATQRVDCLLDSSHSEITSRSTVTLKDGNFPDRIGWHEIVAVGDRTTITATDVPKTSLSKQLTAYPKNRLSSPLHKTEATVQVTPGGPRLPGGLGNAETRRVSDSFLSLVEKQTLTVPFGLLAVAVALFFGMLHAVAPGHGKTVIAAYLVGEKGTRRHALLLGLTVAVTHTGGVLALALVITNSSLAPESLYPLLGSISGALVVGIGIALVLRAVRFRRQLQQFAATTSEPATNSRHQHDTAHAVTARGENSSMDPAAALAHASVLVSEPAPLVDLAEELVPHHNESTAHTHAEPGQQAHDHQHPHHHSHTHPHLHSHPHLEDIEPGSEIRLRSLMAMGFAGGMVPTPSALVVLLGAIALGRAWFGLLLIVAYGIGMAVTLVAAGLLIERARGRLEHILAMRTRPRLTRLAGVLPLATAVAVILGGLLIAARALKIV